MKLFDNLSDKLLQKLALNTVEIGDVYKANMSLVNGIVPKKGDTSRDKYFIVLGFDTHGDIYGGVIINSNINERLPLAIKQLHMPIAKAKYSFLHHNSYVDCSSLKCLTPDKFMDWNYLGEIDDEDVALIKGALKESPIQNKEQLAQFGI